MHASSQVPQRVIIGSGESGIAGYACRNQLTRKGAFTNTRLIIEIQLLTIGYSIRIFSATRLKQ